jgi:hypothetical protein
VQEALSRSYYYHQGGPIILSQIENEYGNVEYGMATLVLIASVFAFIFIYLILCGWFAFIDRGLFNYFPFI